MRDIITIDGPAGVGKSTLAKRVASHVGVAYLDTGAMFRIFAKRLGKAGLELAPQTLADELCTLSFSLSGAGEDTALACNGIVAGQEIRTEEVGVLASEFAQLSTVRAYLKKAQQALGDEYPLVAEGRDMGTAVFPAAKHKFFLDASAEVRAVRRVNQLRQNGLEADLATITAQIKERDDRDRNRAIAPLKPAEDAIIIDTSSLTIDGVFEAIINRLRL
ncbi:MAG: Cytidylate kinase [Desulfovibrio sp.]